MYAMSEPEAAETARSPAVHRRPARGGPGPRATTGKGTLTFLFFSEDLIDIARAKAICSNCPVATTASTRPSTRREPWGVWGGQLLATAGSSP